MGLLVDLGDLGGLDAVLDVLAEKGLVLLGLVSLEGLLVLGDVLTENTLLKDFGVELLGLSVVAGEPLLAVGDQETTIDGTLEGGEDLGTSGGAVETDIKVGSEGAGGISNLLNIENLAINGLVASIVGVQLELLEETAGAKETHGVGGGVVGQTGLDAVLRELVGVGGGEDVVTVKLGSHNLGDDVRVGGADDEAVLGASVLVLVLSNEPLAGIVVGLALTPAPVLDLEALEVSLVLDHLDEDLKERNRKKLFNKIQK